VDETGDVTLPKIGTLSTRDRTADELEVVVREAYDEYLRNPSIEIILLRRVNILGAVRAPGLYPVDPTMTLRDAVALAGGVLQSGEQDRVDLIRSGERRTVQVTGTVRVGDLGLRSGDQLYVPERNWLSRNTGVVASVATTVLSLVASIIIANNY
jgi:protein involved in polysaccharide export with SLBB domain